MTREYPHARRDRRIVAMYREDWTTYEIAAEMGLSRPRICQVLHERGVTTRKWRNRDVTPKAWSSDFSVRRKAKLSHASEISTRPLTSATLIAALTHSGHQS